MFKAHRVVAVVPAGRKRYLEILVPYIRANSRIIDACHLWCNTVNAEDIEYMHGIAEADDGLFQVVSPTVKVNGFRSIHHFFRYCCDPGVVYIRFDDDICWMAPDAVEKLVSFRLANPNYFLVIANTINNSICSTIHQRLGCFGTEEGLCEYDAFGDVSHGSPQLACLAHRSFLNCLKSGDVSGYRVPLWIALNYERIPINCICWLGSEFAPFNGMVGVDEEEWLTRVKPQQLGRPNAICGQALVSHFAYYTQREWLEANTNLLARYRVLSGQVPQ